MGGAGDAGDPLLVRRAGIPELVAQSTGQAATSALHLARRQLVAVHVGITHLVQRALRRDPGALPPGPPLLHIADATAAAVTAAGVQRVGLLGTRFTMEQAYYRDRVAAHGMEVVVPPAAEREAVHRIIYQELIHGRTGPASRDTYLGVVEGLAAAGCQGVIAGCTQVARLRPDRDPATVSDPDPEPPRSPRGQR